MAQTQETEESKLFCCKSYQQRKKGSARLLVLGVYPPPAGAVPRYYPYAKVISSARSDLRAACAPPTRGRFPLLPVCKSYQQCARPTAGPSSEVLGYIYLLIKGSTAPEPPLAVGRQVIACLFYCSPGICPQRGSHPTFGWGDTSAA